MGLLGEFTERVWWWIAGRGMEVITWRVYGEGVVVDYWVEEGAEGDGGIAGRGNYMGRGRNS